MRLAAALSKNAPLSWGMKLASNGKTKEIGFMGFWQLQARLATIILLSLAALIDAGLIGVGLAVIAMLPWGLTATHFYETARANGLPDVLDRPTPNKNYGKRLGGWLFYGLKIYLFDFKQFVFFHVVEPVIRSKKRNPLSFLLKKGLIILCMMTFGVLANHRILRIAGYSPKEVYRGNMLARFANIPFRILETSLILGVIMWLIRILLDHTYEPMVKAALGWV